MECLFLNKPKYIVILCYYISTKKGKQALPRNRSTINFFFVAKVVCINKVIIIIEQNVEVASSKIAALLCAPFHLCMVSKKEIDARVQMNYEYIERVARDVN